MDRQAIERLAIKNEQQTLVQDLQQYRLSPIEARAVSQRIQQYLAERESPGLADGQIFYSAVAFREPAGKPIAQCQLIRIRLTLDDPEDLQYLFRGQGGVPQLRRVRLFRMALEAVEQGARLTQEDFVRLLGVDLRTVRRIIRSYRLAEVYIPTRGYSQDIGRGTSHKAIAVKMYLQYATYTQIEQATHDTAASLIRYLKDFSALVQAIALGVPAHQLPIITGLSKSLVEEYLALYKEYDTPQHQGMLERIRHPLLITHPFGPDEKGGPL
jgi:transcriptional regulator with XRE-family HTH domain